MKHNHTAPRDLNLLRIHLPVTAVLSIAHRLSGVLLAVAVPGLIYLLGLSVHGRDGYAAAAALLHGQGVRLAVALVSWALAHHALAGVRFLLLDLRLGIAKSAARGSAWTVNVGGVLVFLLAAAALL